MYLAELKLWNFRKYGRKDHLKSISKATKPDLVVEFQETLNVLIGENDSGKTAIIDAIKYVLNTKSLEYFRLDEKDFYEHVKGKERERASELRIECKFKDFTNAEAGSFLEWIGFDENNEYELTVWLTATNKDNRIITNVRAGQDDEGIQMDGEARENLKVTYLKPLRDALSELTPGYKSRLAEILGGHSIFQKTINGSNGEKEKHQLELQAIEANDSIRRYFKIKNGETAIDIKTINSEIKELTDKYSRHKFQESEELVYFAQLLDEISNRIKHGREPEGRGAQITKEVKEVLDSLSFKDTGKEPAFELTNEELKDILRSLKLVNDSNKSGLGSLNKLYMAAEFLLLKQSKDRDLKLSLIEELEAHLHPQAQLKIIDALQGNKPISKGQVILTTHSTTLASKVQLDHLILCQNDDVFPMKRGKTKLEVGDYEFLERFLDATKANLFFAKGVILVEGDAENILIPTIAEILGKPLQNFGISVVNVGSTAFMRYAKIFQRKDEKQLHIPVACITDLDIAQKIQKNEVISSKRKIGNKAYVPTIEDEIEKRKVIKDGRVDVFVSPLWTLEHDILNSKELTRELMLSSILEAQLIQNRKSYQGLTNEDIKKKRKRAQRMLEVYEEKEAKWIACKIYSQYLENNRVSKAITAQRFAHHLLDNRAEVKKIIEAAPEFQYIRDAINYVTSLK